MKILPILLFSLLLVTISYADEGAIKKYRNYTPQQIKDMPEEIRKSSLPMMYTFAAQRGLSYGSDLLFGMELNRLMYSGIHNYKNAVKAFQSDLGDKPTGVLTVWQIHKLEQGAEMQKLGRVIFPDAYYSRIDDDYASVYGTVMLIDDKIAYPINHVEVVCSKRDKTCEYDQIQIGVPNETSWGQNLQIIRNNTEYYNITRWNKDSIDGILGGDENRCRITSMNLNFKTKEFYYITRNAGGDCEILGTKLPKLEKPRIAQIVDGEDIIQAEFLKVEKSAYNLLASDFREKVEKLQKEVGTTKK